MLLDPNDIIFDLKHHRHIVYSSISDLNLNLHNDPRVIQYELKEKGGPIAVTAVKPSECLIKATYTATSDVTLTFDINNHTSEISPDILSIYFLTGAGLTYFQDGQECLHSAAEHNLGGYTTRHFVNPPSRRLVKDDWAQVKLVGRKVVALAFNGEELKDSYALAGRVIFRMATPRGNFDTTVNLQITVDEMPF